MNKRMTMTYAVAAGVAATLLLAGCNGGEEDPTPSSSSTGSPTPSGSTSTTASPSPSASASASSDIPAAAKAHTEVGAEEYAKWYALAADAAFVSGDATQLNAAAADDCVGCIALEEGVKEQSADGSRQVSPAVKVERATAAVPPEPNPDAYYVDVAMVVREVEVKNKSGEVVSTTEAGTPSWRVNVKWASDRWTVAAVDAL